MRHDSLKLGASHRLARIKPVGDVYITGLGKVGDKRWRAARHVGGKDRRRLAQLHGPPRLAVSSDIASVYVPLFGPNQEPLNGVKFGWGEFVKVDWQIKHATQSRRVKQHAASGDQLTRSCNGRAQVAIGNAGHHCVFDPGRIAAGDLAAMDAEKLAKLDKTRFNWRLLAHEN